MKKLIITLAQTGNVPTKKINPYTPETPQEIVEDIAKCVGMGVSVAHIHVRDKDGKPTSDRAVFKEVLDGLDQKNVNCIRQLSTGARGGENTLEWRGQMLDLPADMASLSTGSSNFPSSVNANTPELIEALANKMYDNGIVPEIEAFAMLVVCAVHGQFWKERVSPLPFLHQPILLLPEVFLKGSLSPFPVRQIHLSP